jgi:hypothetical protein
MGLLQDTFEVEFDLPDQASAMVVILAMDGINAIHHDGVNVV